MSNITVGSLFDGSGGFPLAGSLCGFEPKWAAEVEPYPIAVTKSRFPNMKHLGSVTDINGAEVEPVDIITFGSPCQDLSVAGKRAGLKHEVNGDDETTRSGLFMEAVRIIKEMREATDELYPRWAVWENVPGAFSSNNGEDFRIVLEELIKIVEPNAVMPPVPKNGWAYADCYYGDGWSIAYRVFDAQYWGVPQRRRRIYLVLDLAGQCAGEVLFEREGLRGYFETGRTPWQTVAADAERSTGTDDREGAVGLAPIAFDTYNMVPIGDKTVTLRAGSEYNYAPVFVPVAYSFDSLASNSMKSSNPHSGCRQVEVAKTLDTTDPNPCKNQGGIAVVEQYLFENHSQDTRFKGPLDVCPMLPAQLGTGGNNTPFVVEGTATPIHDQATRFSGKRGDKSDGKGNGLGVGEPGDPMNTLTSGDRHAVAYTMQETYQKVTGPLMANSHPGSYTGQDAFSDMLVAGPETAGVDCRNMNEYPELYPTLQAKPNGGQSLNFSGAVRVRYIVRRLTPVECARLQGFADWHGEVDPKDDFTEEEYQFWLNVRNTHAAINGKPTKEYTKPQMVSWYNKLHTDSSEYKMWGNGIALPTALYVMQGIADASI